MIKISTAQLWVHDQDEALAFYTEKLGMEVRSDVTIAEMGNFRWLTVGPAGQDDVAIVLMAIPGAPVMDAETADQVRDLMAKGFAGTVFLTTDDCQAAYEDLKGRGVEFTEEPEERPYGIDSGFRDPSGQLVPADAGAGPRNALSTGGLRAGALTCARAERLGVADPAVVIVVAAAAVVPVLGSAEPQRRGVLRSVPAGAVAVADAHLRPRRNAGGFGSTGPPVTT